MKWLYRESIETGILIELEDEAKYKAQGYVDTPDDFGKDSAPELKDMSKDELEEYAKAAFGVDLDKRKGIKRLIDEVKALEGK